MGIPDMLRTCRRRIELTAIMAIACSMAITIAPTWGEAPGGATNDSSAQTLAVQDLQELLEIGLKARRPVEFQFIARVVQLVEISALPRKMVEGTYLWSRRQSSRPFPYFERGLRTRARRIGVEI